MVFGAGSDAKVILLEKNQAGLGVTQDSFAWLNVSYGRPDAYQHLRAQAIAEWRQLDKQTQGQLNINWSGALSWISTPEMELRPFGKSTIIAAEDYIDDSAEQHPERIGESAKAIFCERFRGTETLKLEQVRVGQRPMPNDEMPIVDKISPYQGLYIVTMHAAVTLSPLVCKLAAEEIIKQTEVPLLTPYRLARFS